MRTIRKLLLSVMVILLLGCSNGFVYNHANWWINWYVDDYLAFNREQQRQFDLYVSDQMQWHRSSELPRYERFLHAVRSDVAGEISVTQVRGHFETVYGFWRDFVAKAQPELVQLLADIDDKQVTQLLARVTQDTNEFEADYVTPATDEFVAEQSKHAEKSMRKWIGPLSDAQRDIIHRWASAIRPVYPASLQQRKIWQSALAQALTNRHDKIALSAQLHKLFVSPSDLWSPEYRALMTANELSTAQMLVDVHKSLTVNQRKHLFATIDDYLASLQQLQQAAKKP